MADKSRGKHQSKSQLRRFIPLNLDSTSTSNLLQIMKDLNEKEGMTFVFSTHDQRVINVARRIITVEDGKVISDEVK